VTSCILLNVYKRFAEERSVSLFSDDFAKLRKTTISVVVSVGLSVRPSAWNNADTPGEFS